MEAYLIENNIEYTKDLVGYNINNFNYLEYTNEYLFSQFHEILLSDRYNNLLKKINENDYNYEIKIIDNNSTINMYINIYINCINFTIDLMNYCRFNFIFDVINYIICNLEYITCVQSSYSILAVQIGFYKIIVYDDFVEIRVINKEYKTILNINDFIKFAQKNLTDYFISHDIKIALKD